MPASRNVSIALATALAAAILLPLLGHKPLADWDEGIYAEVSREILRAPGWAGGWLNLHFNFQPWLEKPPLFLWLTAALYRIFGANEFTARAISAFAGIATVATLHSWAARHKSQLAAWLSTIFLIANFGFIRAARRGETDVLLSLFILIAVLGLCRITSRTCGGWLIFWTAFGLAAMTKGAASLVLLPTCLLTLATDSDTRKAFTHDRREFSLGLLLFLFIAAPWHIWMVLHQGAQFTHIYLGWQVLGRSAHPIEGHITHAWYYLWVLAISAPLISLLYPIAALAPFRNHRKSPAAPSMTAPPSWMGGINPDEPKLRPLALFVLCDLVLFSLARTRLAHYIVPACAPLSALTGIWLANWINQRRSASTLSEKAFWQRTGVSFVAAAVLFAAAAHLTEPARRSLRSAALADGTIAPDNKASSQLLKEIATTNDPRAASIPGPLLLWRTGNFVPIASTIFYSQRPVQQVTLTAPQLGTPIDRYTNDPIPLQSAVNDSPHPLLADTPLLTQLPSHLKFTGLHSAAGMTLGILSHNSAIPQ